MLEFRFLGQWSQSSQRAKTGSSTGSWTSEGCNNDHNSQCGRTAGIQPPRVPQRTCRHRVHEAFRDRSGRRLQTPENRRTSEGDTAKETQSEHVDSSISNKFRAPTKQPRKRRSFGQSSRRPNWHRRRRQRPWPSSAARPASCTPPEIPNMPRDPVLRNADAMSVRSFISENGSSGVTDQ